MNTIDDLMRLWPSISDFGRDIGVKPSHAHVMRARGSIPSEHWQAVIDAAAARGIGGITADSLVRLHAKAVEGGS